MTIICAVHRNGETWIGSDRQATQGWRIGHASVKKWIVHGDRALGVSAELRLVNLVANEFDLMAAESSYALSKTLRDLMLANGFQSKSDPDGGAAGYNFSALYATPSGVWDIDQSFGVLAVDDGEMAARGSGLEYALGAFHALRSVGNNDLSNLVMLSVEAAIAYDTGCGGEPFVKKLEAER